MTTLNSRLQLALLNRKKGRNLLEKGFTLVELMIVIVVVGVLSAVALPQFLGVRDKAGLAAEIGEFSGLAKECSAAILIGGPYPDGCGKAGATATDPNTAPEVDVVFTTTTAGAKTAGASCGPDTTLTASENCEIKVNKDSGEITYAAKA